MKADLPRSRIRVRLKFFAFCFAASSSLQRCRQDASGCALRYAPLAGAERCGEYRDVL